jgi:hypothetical protein
MTMSIFSDRLTRWQRDMAIVPETSRLAIFERAAIDLMHVEGATIEAADALTEMAMAHDLPFGLTQDIIGRAGDIPLPNGNGNGKGHGEAPTAFHSKQAFIENLAPPDYLIDGILQRRFIYALTGQTGHAKTAIALLLAELISSEDRNAMLHRHKVRKGRVVYFVGENPDDIRMRLIGANAVRSDDHTKDRIFFIPGVFNIAAVYRQIVAHIERVGSVDLIIVDTSAAYFLGQDENANPQMGAHARMLRTLTELPGGPCVLVLCHPIKHAQDASQLLPRGGGAFLAEMDGNLTCWKHDETLIELHHGKIRGPGFEPLTFKLETIQTAKLVDTLGNMIPTVRANPISLADETAQQKRTRDDEDRVIALLLENPDASVADIAERWNWISDNGTPQKGRVHRALTRLDKTASPKLLRKNRERWELTEEGKKVARIAALKLRAVAEATEQQNLKFQ